MKKCKDCKKEFEVSLLPYWNQSRIRCPECAKVCRYNSSKKYRDSHYEAIKIKKMEYQKNGGTKKICKMCKKPFYGAWASPKFCSRDCFSEDAKTSRLGKNNPAYRNGTRVKGKNESGKHLYVTKKYREAFLNKHGYKFCEYCNINQSLRFETHHIIFASEMPRHKELHNARNLIFVCIQCHNNFHSGKTHEKRISLVQERNLTELFGKSIL